jgi:hypothetical protein
VDLKAVGAFVGALSDCSRHIVRSLEARDGLELLESCITITVNLFLMRPSCNVVHD